MRSKLKYAVKVRSKGRAYWYYRRDGKLWGRLKGGYMDADFMRDYAAIHSTYEGNSRREGIDPMSFAGISRQYIASSEFRLLKPLSKKSYRLYIDGILFEVFGKTQIDRIRRGHVLAFRDKLAATPGKANKCVQVIRLILEWAINRDMLQVNPARGVPGLKLGHHPHWPVPAIEKVLACADPHLRRAFEFGLYTGQRLGDCIMARWDALEEGGLWVKQEKTGTEVWIPPYPALSALLGECPKTAVTILTNRQGRPWSRSTLKNLLRKLVLELDLDGLSYHGLRKTAAVMLAEAGCSNQEIKSITGHSGDQMVSLYTRGARQKMLARAAIEKLTKNRSVKLTVKPDGK